MVRMGSRVVERSLMTLGSSWTWIGGIFFLQAVASVGLTLILGISFHHTGPAISLLLVGGVVALLFRAGPGEVEGGQWRFLVPVGIYVLFIFSLSHNSFGGVSCPVGTKVFHPMEYGTLGLLLCCAWRPILEKKGLAAFLTGVLACGALFGIGDEIHQSFTPGRTSALADVLLDILGTSVGLAVFLIAPRLRKRTLVR